LTAQRLRLLFCLGLAEQVSTDWRFQRTVYLWLLPFLLRLGGAGCRRPNGWLLKVDGLSAVSVGLFKGSAFGSGVLGGM
jgi:hypothetical protein